MRIKRNSQNALHFPEKPKPYAYANGRYFFPAVDNITARVRAVMGSAPTMLVRRTHGKV
jgi:hypothetical protein